MSAPRRPTRAAALALGATLLFAGSAAAQASQGFLFREPVVSLSVRGGFAQAMAGSDLFSFTTENLTLGRRDFSGPALEAAIGIRVAPRFDLVLSGGQSRAVAESEFREFVEQNDAPIEQTTTFSRVPLMASGRMYVTPRGRSIGEFVWIPARAATYVGAGAGGLWYRFRQTGDFVDFATVDDPLGAVIFTDELESSGWAPAAQAFAGLEYSLTPNWALVGEAKYLWSRADLSRDFESFDPIDLSGFTAGIGLSVRF